MSTEERFDDSSFCPACDVGRGEHTCGLPRFLGRPESARSFTQAPNNDHTGPNAHDPAPCPEHGSECRSRWVKIASKYAEENAELRARLERCIADALRAGQSERVDKMMEAE